MTNLQNYWLRKLQQAWDSGEYSDDQFMDLKMEMTDHLDFDECEEVYEHLDVYPHLNAE